MLRMEQPCWALVTTAQSDTGRSPAGCGRALRSGFVREYMGEQGYHRDGSARFWLCSRERYMTEFSYCGTR